MPPTTSASEPLYPVNLIVRVPTDLNPRIIEAASRDSVRKSEWLRSELRRSVEASESRHRAARDARGRRDSPGSRDA